MGINTLDNGRTLRKQEMAFTTITMARDMVISFLSLCFSLLIVFRRGMEER